MDLSPLEALAAFRSEHRRKTFCHGDVGWTYLRSGKGKEPLLLLGGALGEADFGFRAIELLEPDFTIVAPDYAPVRRLEVMVSGLAAVLAAERIESVHVIGGSFGGIVAQAYAALRPNTVQSLTLSHTGPPNGHAAAGIAAAALSLLPGIWLRALFRRRVRHAVTRAGAEWLAIFDESVSRLSKQAILSRVRLAAEFRGDRFAPPPSGRFPVMILAGSDDPLIGDEATGGLARLYPAAEMHRFTGTGHLAAVLEPEAFAGRIRDFVRRVAALPPGGEGR